jgi:general secretion pathway protein D
MLPAVKLVAPSEVNAGATFSVYVNLKTDAPIRGMPLELQFSPQTLELVDIEDGAFFKQDGANVSMTKTIDKAGMASIAVLRNQGDGTKGEGTVAAIRFKAIAAGPAEVRLVSAKAVATPPVELSPLPDAAKLDVKQR